MFSEDHSVGSHWVLMEWLLGERRRDRPATFRGGCEVALVKGFVEFPNQCFLLSVCSTLRLHLLDCLFSMSRNH